jgi:hypothetical protein
MDEHFCRTGPELCMSADGIPVTERANPAILILLLPFWAKDRIIGIC